MAENRWLVVGLGNPGPEYAGNRHNVGFMVLDVLAARIGARFRAHKGRADVVVGRLASEPAVLVKPRSYMNASGGPVAQVAGYYKIPPARTVVVHDELDLPYGVLRLKLGGGSGGHNGLRSLISAVGPDFIRVRVGIGRPPGRMDPADFVLRDFAAAQRAELGVLLERAADAVEELALHGLRDAQNTYHGTE